MQATIGEQLNSFYEENNLGIDGGVNESRVRIDMTSWFYLYIPNPPSRKMVVVKHDIHHMLTGCTIDMKGESEISAWEVGGSCKDYPAAWFLNLSVLMMGMLFNPVNVFKSFIRGRNSRNLYHHELTDEEAKAMTVGELKAFLNIPASGKKLKVTLADVLLFGWWLFVGLIMTVMSIVIFPLLGLYNLFVFADMALAKGKPA